MKHANIEMRKGSLLGGLFYWEMPLTIVTKRVPPGSSGGATQRIVGAITASITVRVPTEVIGLGPFLLLEGDFAGALAYEQDTTDGYLKLQGSY